MIKFKFHRWQQDFKYCEPCFRQVIKLKFCPLCEKTFPDEMDDAPLARVRII
jgi:hypothetical protein